MLKQVSILATVFFCLLQTLSFAKSTNDYWLDGKWPYEKSTLPKHDNALYGRLDNGFRYILQQNANPKDRVSVQLLVQVGSLMENAQERGIAHFLEHLTYNGSKNFPAGKLIPFFQSNGMTFGKNVNAYTSLKETVYKLSLRNKKQSLMDGLTFMRDVADGILIESKEVEAERGVIVSEKNARDSEQYRVRKRLREYLYKDTEFQMVRKDRPYLQWHGNFVSMVKSISLEEINAEITQAFGTQNKAILTGITVKKEQ